MMVRLLPAILCAVFATRALADAWRYELLPFPHAPGEVWTRVEAGASQSDSSAAGYEIGQTGEPFRFSARVPEGNYRVTLTLGNSATTEPSTVTVKAETRRLMVERIAVPARQTISRSFIVNVRTPALPDGSRVKISDREANASHWDDRLTLEFLGNAPTVSGIELDRVDDATTVFLAGDSTVTDQMKEPFAGWGQVLPRFLRHDIAVANYAESGRSLTSFAAERRLAKILSVAKAGDVLLIQFGHNDMKERGEGIGAFGNYAANLRRFIVDARAQGMTPVLVTPMHRRRFGEDGKIQNTFGDYIAAMKQVAQQEAVPLLDLNAMSATLYEALGVEGSKRAFAHYPAGTFPEQPDALKDDTHHNVYGAYGLARCVVEAMRVSGRPELKRLLRDDTAPFDPSKPPDPSTFDVPSSLPRLSATQPTQPTR